MFELCMSGKAWRIFLLSSLAQTMKAFIGRLMCGSLLPRPRDSRNILESDTLGEPEGETGFGREGNVGGRALGEADVIQINQKAIYTEFGELRENFIMFGQVKNNR